MKSCVMLLLSFALFCGAFPAAAAPNVLVIFTDDHGWADLRANGSDADIRTPELDRLTADGVRFTRGYVSAPQCVPSRAGLITGRYQQRFGVEDNNRGPLPLAERTIAERLKQAGYVTGMSGKWHLDLSGKKEAKGALRVQPDFMPHAHGFDEYWRGEKDQYHASHDLQGRPLPDAPAPVTDRRFRVVVQTDAALSFLDRRAQQPERPWFLYLAWYAPHVPLESPEPWFAKTPANLPKERRQALAMIAAMDDGLGRIRAKLRAMNAETNTLIFFIGDNGAPLGKAWNGSLNTPLAGQKGMLSEGGIRTPFVAAWPGRIPPGQIFDQPVISLDVAATAAALAGLPHDPALDGTNLLPFVTGGGGRPHETLYWRWSSQAAALEFPYKFIRLGDRERLLFDVTKPEGEDGAKNLAAKLPAVAARLDAKLTAWCDTLQPPGLPARLDAHHEGLFAEHRIIEKAEAAPAAADPAQGWICRNGTLAVRDGALAIQPGTTATPNARVFITHPGLDVPGPVAVTLRTRAATGGGATITWRTNEPADFVPENAVAFDWPASTEWREVNVPLPVRGRLIHIRITPPGTGRDLGVQSIELTGRDGEVHAWRFAGVTP